MARKKQPRTRRRRGNMTNVGEIYITFGDNPRDGRIVLNSYTSAADVVAALRAFADYIEGLPDEVGGYLLSYADFDEGKMFAGFGP